MLDQHLKKSTVENILKYLGCQVNEATLQDLNCLIHAYVRKVPWESVSRIIKRYSTVQTAECPRWPEEFWQDAMRYGFGGTCFESSLAFYCLLTSLGYEGYLTVNDMGESKACHAAIVIFLDMKKHLVDITIPVHAAVQFSPHKVTKQHTFFHNYTIQPVGDHTYHVERSNHPHPYAFTLIDKPIRITDYYASVENDYSQDGLFLKSVVMTKIIDGKAWRFFSDHTPYKLESFDRQGKTETILSPETWAQTLAEKFNMPEEKILTAFAGIQYSLHANPQICMEASAGECFQIPGRDNRFSRASL